MDVESFCDASRNDLMGWKAKLYDVIRETESLDKVNKEEVAPMITELNRLMDDLDDRIQRLAEECPLEWDTQKTEIEDKLTLVNNQWHALDGAMDVWNMVAEKK